MFAAALMIMKTPPPHSRQQPLLSDDVIIEILSWLPVKPLLRFRCVCRSWKSIIANPGFVKLHLRRSPRNSNIVLTLHDMDDSINICRCAVLCSVRSLLNNPSSAISEDAGYRLEDKYIVIGSCNGLVCLSSPPSWEETRKETWFQFWNPATRIRSKNSPGLVADLWMHLRGTSRLGFGYDQSSDTYKVVAILLDMKAEEDSQKTQVKVHTMGDTCWRDAGSFPALPLQTYNEGVYMNGTLNWFGLRNFSLGHEWHTVSVDRLVIISLDLGKETYRQLLLPDGLDEIPNVELLLGALMDCLCISLEYKRTHFVLWQMKEFGDDKSWTQLLKVSYQHLRIRDFPFQPEDHQLTHGQLIYINPDSLQLYPIWISDNGHVVVLTNVQDSEVILYNCIDNRVVLAKIPSNIMWGKRTDYIQSLVVPL